MKKIKPDRWSAERLSELKALIDNPELSWDARAALMGLGRTTLIKQAQRQGWHVALTPSERQAKATATAAQKKLAANAGKSPKPKAPPKPRNPRERKNAWAAGAFNFRVPEPKKAVVSANDAELIADFLSRKSVTQCPKGWADGSVAPTYIGKGRAA